MTARTGGTARPGAVPELRGGGGARPTRAVCDLAEGDRAGFMQKLSRKGWLCKTWEGELAMVNLPGSVTPQIFHFTVRNDSIAHILQQHLGKQVSITYEEHRGIPTSCFGETSYFVTNVRTLGR